MAPILRFIFSSHHSTFYFVPIAARSFFQQADTKEMAEARADASFIPYVVLRCAQS